MEIDTARLEALVNQVYPGLQMLVRDARLPAPVLASYRVGMVIREHAYTDMTSRVMGMVLPHRYAILSNHVADFSQYEHGTGWGLHVAARGSHFKVLDVFQHQGKTQILLLHLPDDENWVHFQDTVVSIDEELVETSRERFVANCSLEPIRELSTEEWMERCAFPLGMDEHGSLFALGAEPL
jgi:hypothetical protein